MTLAAQMEADISGVFMDTDDFATSITVSNGTHSVALSAIVSATTFETSDGPSLTRMETRDYLIEASKLILNGSLVTPVRGWTVTEGTRTYRMTSPTGEDVFAYEDENRLLLRVHTVLAG